MTAEAYVQRFIDLISKIDAKAEECVTTGEKIHRFRQGLRPSLRGRLEIDSTTGDRFKDFGRLIDVCIKVDDTHRGVQVASLAGGGQCQPGRPQQFLHGQIWHRHIRRGLGQTALSMMMAATGQHPLSEAGVAQESAEAKVLAVRVPRVAALQRPAFSQAQADMGTFHGGPNGCVLNSSRKASV